VLKVRVDLKGVRKSKLLRPRQPVAHGSAFAAVLRAGVNLSMDNSTLEGASELANLNGGKFDECKIEAGCEGDTGGAVAEEFLDNGESNVGGPAKKQNVLGFTHSVQHVFKSFT